MIIARVVLGVGKHWKFRVCEWGLAAILLNWGLNVTLTQGYLARPTWQFLGNMFSQGTWGMLATSIASLRLIALLINGTFADTWWSRYSPHVRAVMAFLSCYFWLTQSLSIGMGGQVATGLSAPAIYIALEFYNIVRASSDARQSDEVFRGTTAR